MSDTDWQTFVQRMDLTYLAGTRFIHADAQTWTILASAVHLPILNEGLRPMLQREARALFGRSVSLRFVDMATVEGDPRLRAILLRGHTDHDAADAVYRSQAELARDLTHQPLGTG